MQPTVSSVGLTWRYLLVAIISMVVAWPLAVMGNQLQYDRWEGPYLLVPVNHVSLYFFPLMVTACTWIAWRTSRLDRTLAIACALVWVWTAGRVLYWYWVASAIDPHATADVFARTISDRRVPSMLVGAIGLTAIVLFSVGIFRTLRADRAAPSNDELQRTRPAQTMEPRR
jgi:hypothetical protein